jgi:hypothetical protein
MKIIPKQIKRQKIFEASTVYLFARSTAAALFFGWDAGAAPGAGVLDREGTAELTLLRLCCM